MAIRHQPKSEKHPFASPTTPGLYVALRDFIIELVCLNVNPKIGQRFWSDPKYWGPKYRREIRGVSNLGKKLDLTDKIIQTALVQIIREYNIKALVAKKTVDRVVKLTNRRVEELRLRRETLVQKVQPIEIDSRKNSTFIDTKEKGVLSKVREVENG